MYRTERNRAQSPLLRLPGEIRNQIYRQLIEDDWDPYWLTSRNKIFRRGSNLEQVPMLRWVESYNLTGICREIRSEFGSLLTSMEELGFWCPVHDYIWAKSASKSTTRGIRSVRFRDMANSTSTLRRCMAALRILPDLEQVVVEICDMWEEERQRLLTDLKDIAAKQSGRWKLVVEE
jgi:hypothetical protein